MTTKFYEDDDKVIFQSGYLSQWFPVSFNINGIEFNCCEQYMMYSKAMYFNDEKTALKVLDTKEPKEQKKLGRLVKGFDDDKWSMVDKDIVFKGNLNKFSQNEELKEKLLSTGNKQIYEASSFDSKWGTGLNIDDMLNTSENEWKGTNLLGKILMQVREAIQ